MTAGTGPGATSDFTGGMSARIANIQITLVPVASFMARLAIPGKSV